MPEFFSKAFIDSSVVCSEDDPNFSAWVSNLGEDDAPSYRYLYLYDVVNAEAFVQGTEKAEVHEKGPWEYRCYDKKFEIAWDNANAEVEYKSYKKCEFQKDSTKNW